MVGPIFGFGIRKLICCVSASVLLLLSRSKDGSNVTVLGHLQNLLRHHEVLENGTAWSNSSESSDDSSSPQLSAGGLCKSINHKVKSIGSECSNHDVTSVR